MKKLMLAAVAALIATPALAGTMDATFGNTTTVTDSKGQVVTYFFEADGTYSAKTTNAEGAMVEGKGAWAIEGDMVCTTPAAMEGAPAPEKACGTYVDGKTVGDTWEITNTAGEKFTVTISAGR